MKHWTWLFLIFAALFLFNSQPTPARDVAQLQPVAAIRITQDNNLLLVETDTGETGRGKTLSDAIEHLKATSSAEIFFDTADYLLISPDLKWIIPQTTAFLRPSCELCVEFGQSDLAQIADFFQIHKPKITLLNYLSGQKELPELHVMEGEMLLVS